jgi:hypothetical protein
MSDSRESVRQQERAELARVFLEAVHYSDGEIRMLGDLSLISFDQVKALLTVKLEEAKIIERIIAENAPDFRSLHGRDEEPK